MAELTQEQKREIVSLLASFYSPAEVVAEMREHHDVELTIRQIVGYDPTRLTFDAGDWARELFAQVREKYTTDVAAIPYAQQAWRLNELGKAYKRALKVKNQVLANQTLKQIAEELGGSYTNEQRLKVEKVEYDPEDARREAKDIINAMLKRKEGQSAPSTDTTQ